MTTTETPTGLLDVNVLVAIVWDSHIHHVPARTWLREHHGARWATCPLTQSGFVRVSSNPKVLEHAVSVVTAREVLRALLRTAGHVFLPDDVSILADDVPEIVGHRQVTDAHLVTLARRHRTRVVTFDRGMLALAGEASVELLRVM